MSIINPIPIYQKPNEREEFVVFTGYVKSVTDRGRYNSVSFKVDSNDSGDEVPLVSVRCFEQKYGVNHKKLVEDTKGRFLVVLAIKNFYNGKTDYIARHICVAPKEFCVSTHPIVDETSIVDEAHIDSDIPEQVAEPEAEYEQLSLFDNIDDNSLPF